MRESSLNQSSVREYSPDALSGLGNNNFGSAYSDNFNKVRKNPQQQQSEYSNGSFDEAKQQRIEKKELDKLKKQFARELKSIIESEIKKQKDEQEKLFKLQKYQSKVQQLEEEKKIIEQAKQQDMRTMSRKNSIRTLVGVESFKQLDPFDSTQSIMGIDHQISEGTKRKTEALLRLKAKNEEKELKREIIKQTKEQEEQEKREKLLKTMSDTQSKFQITIDINKVEQQRKQEERQKKQEEIKAKQEEITARELEKQSKIISKIVEDTQRTVIVHEQKIQKIQLKQELDRARFEEQKQKYTILNMISDSKKQQILKKTLQKKEQANIAIKQKRDLHSAKQNLAKEFSEKKQLIMEKLQELKKNNRSIEEIYKYTNDIIFEEEDEEDEEHLSKQEGSVNAYADQTKVSQNTNRSKSMNQDYRLMNNAQLIQKKRRSNDGIVNSSKTNSKPFLNKSMEIDIETNSNTLPEIEKKPSHMVAEYRNGPGSGGEYDGDIYQEQSFDFQVNLQGNQGKTKSDKGGSSISRTSNQSVMPRIKNQYMLPNIKKINENSIPQSVMSRNENPRYSKNFSSFDTHGSNATKNLKLYTQKQTNDLYQAYTALKKPSRNEEGGIYIPASNPVNQSQQYEKGSLSALFHNNGQETGKQKHIKNKFDLTPNKNNDSYSNNGQRQIPIMDSSSAKKQQSSLLGQQDNQFLIELVRRRQKEEILSVIRDEEKNELDRLKQLKDPTRQNLIEDLQRQFAFERKNAQLRITELMKKHEDQIINLQNGGDYKNEVNLELRQQQQQQIKKPPLQQRQQIQQIYNRQFI